LSPDYCQPCYGVSLHVWAEQSKPYPVRIRQIEFRDGERHLALAMFYPAEGGDNAAPNFNLPFFVNLHLYKDADIAGADGKYPLVMFSHGRGSNPLQYAWFAETLASHGYIVAAPYHYRANTYDSTIAYLANKLWQRPLDISFDITALLNDPAWGKRVDAARIGIAGHSQGDFTSLWIGGAKVNADKYLAFQKGWKNNPSVPTYITVSARDTQAPPGDNAEFAAKHIPHAELSIIPGDVDHEIFVNECDHEGRDEFPEACIERRA